MVEHDGLLCFKRLHLFPMILTCAVASHHNIMTPEWQDNAGHWKTLELVIRNYWWPQMSRYIGSM